ncbi:MAG TPA: NAD(P)-dependent oxidoreductase [Tepidisphaeraceae bacterium]|jgi:phosphoglycerate dehydrogenase-like enzyme|nr:NAD(P)-dependent oxidoreductase [Tepidisphaeraceae bacterium]
MFQVTLTADFYDANGNPKYADLGLDSLKNRSNIQVNSFSEHRKEITPDQIAASNALLVLTPSVTRQTVSSADNLLAIARFGVGYDSVDVPACTAANVAVCITTGAVDRPVAEAVVGWMISLSHNVLIKDRLVRQGLWDQRSNHMGSELRNRTLGLIGAGGIARKLVSLLSNWDMNPPLAFDPFLKPETAKQLGIELVPLDTLLSQSDFVSIHCPLTDQTRNLIGPRELSLMKPTAYLINSARGGIIHEDSLYTALKEKRIAGAALDCFTTEPVTTPSRFADLENVLLAPHSIAWTNELFRDIGRTASQSLLDLTQHKPPHGLLNPELLSSPAFQEKWKRLCL